MLSYPLLMVLVFMTGVVGIIISLFIFADVRNLTKAGMIRGVEKHWPWTILLGFVFLMIMVENLTHHFFYHDLLNEANFTKLIYDMSFQGRIGLGIQTGLRSDAMDIFLMGIYIYFYTFILFFTPLMFMLRDDGLRMRRYCLAIFFIFIVLLPFYFFFAVETPSMSGLVATEPVMYHNQTLLEFVKSVDPLDNSFPSGHIAVPWATLFLLMPVRAHSQYRRYFYFILVITMLITLAVLYLGAHWVADVASAILLAYIIVWLVKQRRIMKWAEKRVRFFFGRWMKY